ncbi:hypothetical protein G6F59_015403 [Rhizopus arrhizus]|nr:hypothetical protein G6F59_015403 [Rhizopus arrhizus]
MAADADAARLGHAFAQQQAHDGGLACAAGADDADPFAGRDAERQALLRTTVGRVRERDLVELDGGRQAGRRGACRARIRCRRQRLRIHQRVDADRGGLAQHAAVQARTQVAQGAEDLGAGHQHDQQRFDAHVAGGHAPGAQRQRQRGAQRHAQKVLSDRLRARAASRWPQALPWP